MDDNKKPSATSGMEDPLTRIRYQQVALLRDLEEWFDGEADGAPDAPGWRKEAGILAERIRAALGITYREARDPDTP